MQKPRVQGSADGKSRDPTITTTLIETRREATTVMKRGVVTTKTRTATKASMRKEQTHGRTIVLMKTIKKTRRNAIRMTKVAKSKALTAMRKTLEPALEPAARTQRFSRASSRVASVGEQKRSQTRPHTRKKKRCSMTSNMSKQKHRFLSAHMRKARTKTRTRILMIASPSTDTLTIRAGNPYPNYLTQTMIVFSNRDLV